MDETNPETKMEKEMREIRRALEALAEQVRVGRIPLSPLMSVSEAAKLLGVGTRTVHRLLADGRLTGTKMPSGRGERTTWMIQTSDLQAFIERGKVVRHPAADRRAVERDRSAQKRRTIIVPNIKL